MVRKKKVTPATIHETHRADPNYPREHAGSCDYCLDLAVQLELADVAGVAERMQEKAAQMVEEHAIDTGQLTRAQRTALLLYPGDGAADRMARALMIGDRASWIAAYCEAHPEASIHEAEADWQQEQHEPVEEPPVRFVGIPPLREYTELVTTHISRAVSAHYASAESQRSRQLTPYFYARRAIECLEQVLPPSVSLEPGEAPAPVVADDVLRLVARTVCPALVVPADPSSQGYRFWSGAVSDVQDHIGEHGTEGLLEDPRWHTTELGEGRILDRCSSSQLAHMVAEIEATEFPGVVDVDEVRSLDQALETALTMVYEAVWEAVSRLLGDGGLRVQYRGQQDGAPVPLLAVAG